MRPKLIQFPLFSLCILFIFPTVIKAETWTDSSGKFAVEAEFQGVEGSSIVLLKENGVTITVPISKLSDESKALAKSLFDKMNGKAEPSKSTDESSEQSTQTSLPKRTLSFTAPEPATLSAMPKFPEDSTLQETVDFVKAQIEAGHLEVLWHALPQEMRDELDSPEVRKAVNPFVQQQSQMLKSVEKLVFKAIEVLVTKKEFVLGSSMMDQLPPGTLPMVTQAYDPAIGMVFELSDLGFRSSDLQNISITTLVDHYGPRVGSHMKGLMELLPQEVTSSLTGDMKVEMIDSDNGVIKTPETQGLGGPAGQLGIEAEDMKMTRFMGRWIPADLANEWPTMQAVLKSDLEGALDAQQNSEDVQGAMMMVGMMSAVVGGVLDQLLAADSQEAFDQVLMQSAAMLGPNLGGGGIAPGGPGLGGPGLGGPGGLDF